MRKQRTLTKSVNFYGVTLHSGKKTRVTVRPGDAGSGIVFRRIDSTGKQTEIPAHWSRTQIELPLCTCLSADNGIQIRTVEHLLAACYACTIDNAIIEVDGGEIPIYDGSAAHFVQAFDRVGTIEQALPIKTIKVLKTVEIREDKRFIRIEPAKTARIDLSIALAKIGPLNWSGATDPKTFKQAICNARTFGRLRNGLLAKIFTRFSAVPICLGANLNTSLVIVGSGVINKGGLRTPDEYVRHRVLDVIADMSLAGTPLIGKITASSPAHRLNHALLEKLFSDEKAWQY